MQIFKVAYEPPFSSHLKSHIKNMVVASMISSDGETEQFPLDQIDDKEWIMDQCRGNDKEVLLELKRNNVEYVELS